MNETIINTKVKGHVIITDGTTGEILLDKANAVHAQNLGTAISRGLAHSDYSLSTGNHQIYALELGNGGASVDSMNQITYLPPNITGTGARLYSQTYFDIVDPGAQSNNSVTYQQSQTDTTSIIIVTMTVNAGEPSGQDTSDSPPDPNFNSTYSFDELALFTYGSAGTFTYTTTPTDALLLTHIIFSPILKTANRSLTVTYTLSVAVS
jgi:hypothetical protein